jgi:hypothetical protein
MKLPSSMEVSIKLDTLPIKSHSLPSKNLQIVDAKSDTKNLYGNLKIFYLILPIKYIDFFSGRLYNPHVIWFR